MSAERTDEQRGREGEMLKFAHDYLEAYYKMHGIGVREVITSQWGRGFVDGRTEALNILACAAKLIGRG